MADGSNIAKAVRIGAATLSDLEFVALQMREDERAQWLAITGRDEYDPWLCARTLAAIPGQQFVLVGPDGRPFMVGGLTEVRAGVLQSWAAATEGSWDKHWRAITAHTRWLFRNALASGQAHRVETIASASRTEAARWYVSGCGQQFEGVLRSYFADGSDAAVFSRVLDRPRVPRRLQSEA